MIVKPRRLLDSYAVLAYLNGEEGAGKVREVMEEAGNIGEPLLISEINVGEVYYILGRKRGMEKADYFIDTILPGLPIQVLPVDFPLVMEAARLKAKHTLSYTDCFAVAAALRSGASILTGDPEFRAAAGLLTIEWLGKDGG
jgi:predicted nucleic acid-binding protein